MKRLIVFAFALICMSAYSQTSAEFLEKYNNQVMRVGYSGPGVAGILDKWEAAFPEDGEMLRGRFSMYFDMSRKSEVVQKNAKKFMGAEPTLALKDSLGNPVNYFMENVFNDSLFNMALKYIDCALELYPREMSFCAEKFAALVAYEKESPKRSLKLACDFADYRKKNLKFPWTMFGQPANSMTFQMQMQDFCYSYYAIASPDSYEAFYQLSLKMSKMYPKNEVFLGDLGNYYLVARRDTKNAAKYYNKVLALDPTNELATKNMELVKKLDAAKAAAKSKKR